MCLDNGSADREPYAHTVVLRTVERLEEPVGRLGSEADAGILNPEPNVLGAIPSVWISSCLGRSSISFITSIELRSRLMITC